MRPIQGRNCPWFLCPRHPVLTSPHRCRCQGTWRVEAAPRNAPCAAPRPTGMTVPNGRWKPVPTRKADDSGTADSSINLDSDSFRLSICFSSRWPTWMSFSNSRQKSATSWNLDAWAGCRMHYFLPKTSNKGFWSGEYEAWMILPNKRAYCLIAQCGIEILTSFLSCMWTVS